MRVYLLLPYFATHSFHSIFGITLIQNSALIHYYHLSTKILHIIYNMSRKNDDGIGGYLAQQILKAIALHRVQSGSRLIHYYQFGIAYQRLSYAKALPHTP